MELEQGLWGCCKRSELNKFLKGDYTNVGRLDIQIRMQNQKITSKFESLDREDSCYDINQSQRRTHLEGSVMSSF